MKSNLRNKNVSDIEEAKPKFCSISTMPPNSKLSKLSFHQGKGSSRSVTMFPKEKHCYQPQAHQPGTKKARRWAVINAKPKPLWPLTRGTMLIDECPRIVSGRIDESLRLGSVQVQFDEHHAEVFCKTRDFLQYKVCLYAGDEGGTYVEVIRMVGCALRFVEQRQNIMNAAKGLGGHLPAPPSKKMKIPADLLDLYVPPSINDLEIILDRTCDRLSSNNRQVVLFALQNLVSITTASEVHSETAHNMGKLIMENKNCILDMITSVYAFETQNRRGRYSEQICSACLSILINGIISLSTKRNNRSLDEECTNFIENLVPFLIKGVSSYECTHNTCLALQCLLLLVTKSSLACMKIGEMKANDIIEKAGHYGSIEHLRLEETAKSVLNVLQTRITVV